MPKVQEAGSTKVCRRSQENAASKIMEVKMEKARDIDSKFAVSTDSQIYKKSNEEIVPEDEPLFLLRGRDVLAIKLLMAYAEISKEAGCSPYHFMKLGETIAGFIRFKKDHSERMKMPSITEGK